MSETNLYNNLTLNISKNINLFQQNKISVDKFNEQLSLNIFCLIKNKDKKKENKLEETILDIYVPYSRLNYEVKKKLNLPENNLVSNDTFNYTTLKESEFLDNDSKLLDFRESIMNDKIKRNDKNNDNEESSSSSLFEKSSISEEDSSDNEYNKPFKMKVEYVISNDSFSETSNIDTDADTNLKNSKGKENSVQLIKKKKNEIEEALDEYKNIIKPKILSEILKDTNIDYVHYMQNTFDNIKFKCRESLISSHSFEEENSLVNSFRDFLLNIGLTEKNFYNNTLRTLIYKRKDFGFTEFLEIFRPFLNKSNPDKQIKYKFLLFITPRENEEFFQEEELNKYFDLISNCKVIKGEVNELIKKKLISEYQKTFPQEKLYVSKIKIVLEQFF